MQIKKQVKKQLAKAPHAGKIWSQKIPWKISWTISWIISWKKFRGLFPPSAFAPIALAAVFLSAADPASGEQNTESEICFSLDQQAVHLKNLINFNNAIISPDGRFVIYEEKIDDSPEEKRVVLLDLDTMEKKVFLSEKDLKSDQDLKGDPAELLESLNPRGESHQSPAREQSASAANPQQTDQNRQPARPEANQQPPDPAAESPPERKEWQKGGSLTYDISIDGAFALGMEQNKNLLKIWSLPDLEEKIIPFSKNRVVWSAGFAANGLLVILETKKEFREYLKINEYYVNRALIALDAQTPNAQEEIEKIKAALNEYTIEKKDADFQLRVVDPRSLRENKISIPNNLPLDICGALALGQNSYIRVQKDGSITEIPLTLEETKIRQVFGPVEGLDLSNFAESLGNCGSFEGSDRSFINVLLDPKGKGYIVRSFKDKKESFLPSEILTFQEKENNEIKWKKLEINSVLRLRHLFSYPFARNPRSNKVYHIPSGHSARINGLVDLYFGGKLSAELKIPDGRKSLEDSIETDVQFVFNPLNPFERKIALKIKLDEVCKTAAVLHGNDLIVSANFGDTFFINVQTGAVRRRFGYTGICSPILGSFSKNLKAFLAMNSEAKHIAYRYSEQCVKLEGSPAESEKEILSALSQAENPTDPLYMSQLIPILEKDSGEWKRPQLIERALWRILLRSPSLYLDLRRRYPQLSALPVSDSYPDFGPDTRLRLIDSAKSVLEMTASEVRYAKLSDWSFLRMLKPVLRELPEKDQSRYIEKITVSLSNGAAQQIPLLQDVFQSKIYYTVNGHVREIFGLEREPVSDITIARKKDSFSTVILSSDPIAEHPSTATDFGLHYAVLKLAGEKKLQETISPAALDERIEWSLLPANGEPRLYRAAVQIQSGGRINTFVSPSPHYSSVWQDHLMAGAMIVGSSLRGYSSELLEEYLSYFKEEGFQFSAIKDDNLKEFFLERVQNCELDYFLKESHSDGDERNVFRFDRANNIIRAIRYGEEGRLELVYLIFPQHLKSEEKNTDLLSHKELRQALRAREEKGCGEITYFNTSCWSHVKARYEIEAANSFLFLNIPAVNLTDTFENSPSGAIRALLHSYRNGLDFDGFREALQKNKGYASGSRNRYIFPDKALYHNIISQHIRIPLKINIELERLEEGVWRKIDPDEAL